MSSIDVETASLDDLIDEYAEALRAIENAKEKAEKIMKKHDLQGYHGIGKPMGKAVIEQYTAAASRICVVMARRCPGHMRKITASEPLGLSTWIPGDTFMMVELSPGAISGGWNVLIPSGDLRYMTAIVLTRYTERMSE